jgi:hypothetical protein
MSDQGAEVKSEWRGDKLWWCIEGQWVSHESLKQWVYRNMDSPDNYVDVIRRCHTDAYAKRERGGS